jgi:hypothetical protein
MNDAGRPEFAIDLRVRAADASLTKVILVFRTKISTFSLRMIHARCHAGIPHAIPANAVIRSFRRFCRPSNVADQFTGKAHHSHTSPKTIAVCPSSTPTAFANILSKPTNVKGRQPCTFRQ